MDYKTTIFWLGDHLFSTLFRNSFYPQEAGFPYYVNYLLYARYAREQSEQSEQKLYCSSYSPNVRRTFGEYLASMTEHEEQSSEHDRAWGAKFEHTREQFEHKFLCSNSCSASMLGERSAFLRSNSCSFPTVGLVNEIVVIDLSVVLGHLIVEVVGLALFSGLVALIFLNVVVSVLFVYLLRIQTFQGHSYIKWKNHIVF